MRQQLTRLELTDFRNYSSASLNLDADLVFFIGENGAGKTSILEAIGVAALLRSFRGTTDRDLIRFDGSFYSVTTTYRSGTAETRQHIAFGKEPKSNSTKEIRKMSINGEKVKRSADYIGRLQTVFFSPHDIDIIDSGPAERRRFLDMQISSLYPGYYEALQKYNRSMKLRSSLLRSSAHPDKLYLASLDKELAGSGSEILKRRSEFLEDFIPPFQKYVQLISGSKDSWNLIYRPSLKASGSSEYLSTLQNNLSRDLRLKQTTLGIHRDQIVFTPKNMQEGPDISKVASQGQKRTVALSLRMAQYELVKSIRQENPVLLIDDVLNELDTDRRHHFVHFLHEIGQALITTTEIDAIRDYLAERNDVRTLIYEIKNGNLTRVSSVV